MPGQVELGSYLKRCGGEMLRQLTNLAVERVIFQDVPKRQASEDRPLKGLTTVETELTDVLRNRLTTKVKASLGRHASEVVFADPTGSPVPDLVRGHFIEAGGGVMALSHVLSQHLYSCQKGRISGGLLVVGLAQLANQPALVLVKLEREEGIRTIREVEGDEVRVTLQFIEDVVLSTNTRLFKAGIFYQDGGEIVGLVSDDQRGRARKGDVADFFLHQFLGCRLREAPEVTTRHFFEAAQRFINENVPDPEPRGRYMMAVVSELASQHATVDPVQFALDHLDTHDRAPFEARLVEAAVPTRPFDKQNDLIANQLKKVQFSFDNGIAVLGPQEAFEQHTEISNLQDGRTVLRVEGTVTNVRGRA